MLCMVLETGSSARQLSTANVGAVGMTYFVLLLKCDIYFIYFYFLGDAMCDLAAALNPASQGLSGWDCSGGTPLASVICGWGGVSCNSDPSVAAISLGGHQLTGTLPTSIGSLIALTGLYLSSNSIGGIIPSSIGGLTLLTALYLNSDSFTGVLPQSICNAPLINVILTSSGLTSYPDCLSSAPGLNAAGLSVYTVSPTGNIHMHTYMHAYT